MNFRLCLKLLTESKKCKKHRILILMVRFAFREREKGGGGGGGGGGMTERR